MKKVAVVLYYYHPYVSGLSVYAKRIVETLAATGEYEVTVYAARHDKSIPSEEVIDGIRVKRFRTLFSVSRWVFAPGIFWSLIRQRRQYDQVFVFMPLLEAAILPFFFAKQALSSFYVCDISLGKRFPLNIAEKLTYLSMHFLGRRSQRIAVLSLDYYNSSKYRHPLLTPKVVGLNPIVEFPDYSQVTAADVTAYRARFGIEETDFVIGFLGRLVHEKGITYLLEAIEPLHAAGLQNFKILIGGDYKGIRGKSIYDEIGDLLEKYKGQVTVTGFIPEAEKATFMKALDVFVLPSVDPLEAFGIVQLEAISAGVPVVASALPGVREIVQNTKFGFLAEPRSSSDLARQILAVKQQRAELEKHRDSYKKYYSEAILRQHVKDAFQ